MIWRGYLEHTYFTCMRCQQKWPIEEMQWDDGLLVCTYRCKDAAINGAFEYRVAQEVSKDCQELQPDPKLINPVDPASQIETISAVAGGF
jgi:hypothetical protein